MRHLMIAVSIAICSLLANGCSKSITPATSATVLSVRGKVLFGNAQQNDFQPFTLKSRIRGKIIVLFIPSDGLASQFVITASELTIKPDSACLFCVRSDGTTTRVTCAKGNINVSAEAQPPVTIAAGYFQEWPNKGAKAVAAADDATAQIDTAESLESGERLQDEASRLPNRRPF